ncbi:hypothetical protein ACH5RR_021275 [Cinchona calisaya]|uniref:Uncharacterized protein n=1 Tax=Cinchona calisaya TaxID=153742 RepID=A0ABD2ZGU7_9GENT
MMEEVMWEMEEGEFPKLKFLKLEYLDIVRWIGSGELFPCLQKLVLGEGVELVELPSCLGCISTLEFIEMHYCPDSLISLVREIEEEQISMGNVDMKVLNFRIDEED